MMAQIPKEEEEDDLDCVILMSYHQDSGSKQQAASYQKKEEERFHFYYAMGFVDSNHNNDKKDAPESGVSVKQITSEVRVVVVREEEACELFLCANVSASFVRNEPGWTEAKWETFMAEHIDSKVMRVQTACTVTEDKDGGGACIERLIEKDLMARLKRAANHAVPVNYDLLNCYRAASGGRMHHLDRRPWLMSVLVTAQMQFEVQSALERVMTLTLQGVELGARIRDGNDIIECARFLAGNENQLNADRQFVITQTEIELAQLEAQEMEMLTEADALHKKAISLSSILDFQDELRMAEEDPRRAGKEEPISKRQKK